MANLLLSTDTPVSLFSYSVAVTSIGIVYSYSSDVADKTETRVLRELASTCIQDYSCRS